MQVFSRVRRLEVAIAKAVAPSAYTVGARTATTIAGENVKWLLMGSEMAALPSSPLFSSSRQLSLYKGELMSLQIKSTFGRGRAFCSTVNSAPPPNNQAPAQPQTPPAPITPPPPPPPPPSYTTVQQDQYQSSTIRRRPYNVEAKMRMKAYRREAMQRQYAQEIEDEEKYFQIDQEAMYKKGDPGTVQGIVRDHSTVGYFVTLPNRREGFLACSQLGCSGGIPLLQRLYKVGDEITVRAEIVGDGGRDRLYTKKGS